MLQKPCIAGFGEIMLRLMPPGGRRLVQTLPGTLEATFGGSEVNCCAALALLGARTEFLTRLPEQPVAQAALMQLRGLGVGVDRVIFDERGRLGVYYVESGAAQRGGQVIYDRENSAIALAGPERYDFARLLEGVDWLHVSGITPALSEAAYRSTRALVEAAAERRITISCDLNFRRRLWRWRPEVEPRELARTCLTPLVAACSLIVASAANVEEVFGCGAAADPLGTARELSRKFPGVDRIAMTLRQCRSADEHDWGAMLYDCRSGRAYFAPTDEAGRYAPYRIGRIVDAFGGGDAFAAGLIYALSSGEFPEPERALAFAAAAGCLKLGVWSDYNYVTREEVLALMGGDAAGRLQR